MFVISLSGFFIPCDVYIILYNDVYIIINYDKTEASEWSMYSNSYFKKQTGLSLVNKNRNDGFCYGWTDSSACAYVYPTPLFGRLFSLATPLFVTSTF